MSAASALGPALLSAVLAAVAVLVWPPRGAQEEAGAGPSVPGPGTPASRRSRGAAAVPSGKHLVRLLGSVGRRGRTDPTQEVQLLDGLAAALEAGLPAEQAVHLALDPFAGATPVRAGAAGTGPWVEVARAAGEGQPLAPAWHRVSRRTGSRTAASVARAWAVAAATGAPVAAAVRSSAHAARERRRLERAVETATAGARATATVLGLLPVAGVALAALLGVGPVELYGHPLALASAGLGVVLLVVGHLSVRRMVRSVLGGVA